MVASGLNIFRHLVFKWQHALRVQVTRACDQVFCVRVFARQLIPYQVAAVIEIITFHHAVIAHSVPARRLHRAYGAAFFCGHGVCAYARESHTAAAKAVKLAIFFKGAA